MNTLLKLAAVASVSAALIGCSNDPDTTGETPFTPYSRIAPLPTQMATIEISDPLGILAAPTITITQADDVELNASVVTDGTGSVTLSMALTNNTGRALFNPKVVATALSQGDVGLNTSSNTGTIHSNAPELAGLEYWGFGLRGLPDGDSASGENVMVVDSIVSVDNGDGTVSNSPLIIQVEMPTTHSMAYTNNGSWGDIERGDIMGQRVDDEWYDDAQRGGAYSWDNQYHMGAVTPDGQYLFLGTRNLPVIMVHDTFEVINHDSPTIARIALLENPARGGYVPSVSMSPDGHYLYASVMPDAHEGNTTWGASAHIDPQNYYLVKVDVATQAVVARLELFMPGREGSRIKPRHLSMTADGTMGALAIDFVGGIQLIDLTGEMSVVETFDTMANGYGERIRNAAITPDGSRIFFPDASDNFSYTYGDYVDSDNVIALDVATGAYSQLVVTDQITSTPRQFEFGPDGRLYHVGDCSQVNVYDVDTMTQVAAYDQYTCSDHFGFDGEGEFLYSFDSSRTSIYDLSDDTYTGVTYTGLNVGEGFGLVSPY